MGLPWLAGLLILSWLGRYNGSPPTVFGVTLLATNHLPNWCDLATIAAFSLVIYYWAVHTPCPTSASARPWSRWRPRRPSNWKRRSSDTCWRGGPEPEDPARPGPSDGSGSTATTDSGPRLPMSRADSPNMQVLALRLGYLPGKQPPYGHLAHGPDYG